MCDVVAQTWTVECWRPAKTYTGRLGCEQCALLMTKQLRIEVTKLKRHTDSPFPHIRGPLKERGSIAVRVGQN